MASNERHPPRVAFVVLAGVACLTLGACAQHVGGAPAPTTLLSTAHVSAAAADPVHLAADGSLAAAVTYDSGMLRFDPVTAPPGAITLGAAEASFAKTGLAAGLPKESQPQEFLAVYRDFGRGVSNGSPQPVWVIRYAGVISGDSGTCCPHAAGTTLSPEPTEASVPHDAVAVVNALTGVCLVLLEDVPDAVAQPDPIPQPDAHASPVPKPSS